LPRTLFYGTTVSASPAFSNRFILATFWLARKLRLDLWSLARLRPWHFHWGIGGSVFLF